MKKPAFQFYPGDWRKDQNLSRASLSAKGAMIEIMCLAFESEKRGMLITNGKPWTIEEIAYAMGGDKLVNISAIEELLDKKILKKSKKNVIFSSRMVKDDKITKLRRVAGLKGGNPTLLNHKHKQTFKQKPTPSSSTSSSTSVKKEEHQQNIFEMLRRVTRGVTDETLFSEAGKFLNKYPNVKPNDAAALINSWAGNIRTEEKKMVL